MQRQLNQQMRNFEDMRTNAMELSLLKQVTAMQQDKERDMIRDSTIPSLFKPLLSIVMDLPNLMCSFVGGRLALGGAMSPASLTDFSIQAAKLVKVAEVLQDQVGIFISSVESPVLSMDTKANALPAGNVCSIQFD